MEEDIGQNPCQGSEDCFISAPRQQSAQTRAQCTCGQQFILLAHMVIKPQLALLLQHVDIYVFVVVLLV